jgi:multidrug transporter EmrE-like cation transporter
MWDGLSGIVETLAAYFILGERFDSWEHYIGLALIVSGLFLLKSGKIPYK